MKTKQIIFLLFLSLYSCNIDLNEKPNDKTSKEGYFEKTNRLNRTMDKRLKVIALGERYSIITVDGREILSNHRGGMMYLDKLKTNKNCCCYQN